MERNNTKIIPLKKKIITVDSKNLKRLSFADLYAMQQFADNNAEKYREEDEEIYDYWIFISNFIEDLLFDKTSTIFL